MRLPTKNEVLDFINIVKKEKRQHTELGLKRIAARYFHCKIKEIETILN